MADIYLSERGRSRVYQLPVIPENMPEISLDAEIVEFKSFGDGVYTINAGAGLRELTLSGWLPNRHYSFCKSNDTGDEIISMMENAMKKKRPVRVVLSCSGSVSMTMHIMSLSHYHNRTGDVVYSAQLKESR